MVALSNKIFVTFSPEGTWQLNTVVKLLPATTELEPEDTHVVIKPHSYVVAELKLDRI
jgi:hypothetical protein